jgi:C4-dicarboxylate-specific signal transduction histidine kinase
MRLLGSLKSIINQVKTIGDQSNDSQETIRQHHFLIYMSFFMSCGGLLWGGLYLFFEELIASLIPFSYVVVTGFNLLYFKRSKNFHLVRIIQVFMSLLLPIILQLMLGGFIHSGAVMLWSFVALGGSLTFSDMRLSIYWWVLYIIGVFTCGILEEQVRESYDLLSSLNSSTFFFVINISAITSIFFFLTTIMINVYRNTQKELVLANTEVAQFVTTLEGHVEERTKALQDTLARTEAIVAHLADGLVAVDIDFNITFLNQVFRDIVIEKGTFVSDDHSQKKIELPSTIKKLIKQCFETHHVTTTELILNENQIATATASPIFLNSIILDLQHITHDCFSHQKKDILSGCVVLIQDITSKRKLIDIEAQLAISERMSALGTLAAGIAHEINNPLTYVMGSLELLKEELGSHDQNNAEEIEELVSDSIEGVDRVAKIVEELRSFMRVKKLELAPVSLEQVIQSGMNLAQHETKHSARIEWQPRSNLPAVHVNEYQLVQVIVNLLINAAQAFTHKDLSKNRIWIRAKQLTQDELSLEIQDNACGMSPKIVRKIFDPFFTTKVAIGTGLGLAICHRIMSDFGGKIQLSSEEGIGSTFTLILPLASKEVLSTILDPTPPTTPTYTDLSQVRTVMVIDDETIVGQVISKIIGTECVHFFSSGVLALNALDEIKPNVIICDVVMPEINGVEVYKVLKQKGYQDHTFLITGGAISNQLTEELNQLAPSIMYKPFTVQELRDKVWSTYLKTQKTSV